MRRSDRARTRSAASLIRHEANKKSTTIAALASTVSMCQPMRASPCSCSRRGTRTREREKERNLRISPRSLSAARVITESDNQKRSFNAPSASRKIGKAAWTRREGDDDTARSSSSSPSSASSSSSPREPNRYRVDITRVFEISRDSGY